MQTLWQDLRYGVRMLRKNPGFTAVAVLTLALGIGANTAIFSVVDAVLLKSLPVHQPEQLVMLGSASQPYCPYPRFTQFRDRNQVFSGIFAIADLERSNITVNGPDASPVPVQLVSGSYFSVLGVSAVLGRTFTLDDDRVPGAHPVAVISASYWKRRLAQTPDVVGRTLTLSGTTYTIIGVTPPGFSGEMIGHPADLWIPIAMQSQVMVERPGLLSNPNPPWMRVIARLKSGVTMEQARAQSELLLRQTLIERAGPNPAPEILQEISRSTLELEPENRGFAFERAYLARPLLILTIIVALVLLIACANVATLLLARSSARQKEIATRLALGAGRRRLIRQLLTESWLLALLGGVLGWLFAFWGTEGLLKVMASGTTPLYLTATLDGRIFAFTSAVCLAAAILFGLAPAIRATRVPLMLAIKDDASALQARRFGLGGVLVVLQVAVSLLLLIGAGLFVGTLRNLKAQDLGFDREQVLLVWAAPEQAGRRGATLARLYETIEQRIGLLPGVRSASVSSLGLLGSEESGSPITVEGYTPRPTDEYFIPWNLVAPKFFETVGMRLLQGRDFSPQDTEASRHVAIVNESFAHYYFGHQSPIGKRFETRGRGAAEIIGVVRDAKYNTLREKDVKMIYRPYRQDANHLWGKMCVVVRTFADPAAVAASVRRELHNIDPALPVLSIASVEQQLNQTLVQERLIALLSSFFGGLALLLSAIGLYGIVSYGVANRTNEIGIRMALGAQQRDVLWLILREALLLALAGVVVGLPAALGATRLISSLLFGLKPTDPVSVSLAALLMLVVAIVAGYLPARRASRVEPMVALRDE